MEEGWRVQLSSSEATASDYEEVRAKTETDQWHKIELFEKEDQVRDHSQNPKGGIFLSGGNPHPPLRFCKSLLMLLDQKIVECEFW